MFEKVIVITDRQVLDRQLQAQVKASEQVPGTVREINESSAQLREALGGEQARLIISTLQKFPYVLAQLTGSNSTLEHRTYAVIVDEAHSSQTGKSAVDLKAVLGNPPADDEDDEDDGVPEVLRGVLDDEDFRQRTTYLAMRALYDRYRSDESAAAGSGT